MENKGDSWDLEPKKKTYWRNLHVRQTNVKSFIDIGIPNEPNICYNERAQIPFRTGQIPDAIESTAHLLFRQQF